MNSFFYVFEITLSRLTLILISPTAPLSTATAPSCNKVTPVSKVSDPGFFQIPDPVVCTSNGEIFSNVYELNVLDTFKRHLFCFYTFDVRCLL